MKQPAQNNRLRTLKMAVRGYAEPNEENLKTVYYAMLLNYLRSQKQWKEFNEVQSVISGINTMTAAKCLAVRVTGFMSTTRYRRTQQVTNFTANKRVFEPYSALVKEEKNYLPGTGAVEAINIPENFPEFGLPNVKAKKFHYHEALEMTLKDLEEEMGNGLKEAGEDADNFSGTMKVYVKDGGDGMGEVKCKQHQTSQKKLPDKAVRYSCSLLKVTAQQGDREITIYEETKPNSHQNCRPLLLALADENDYFSLTTLLNDLMRERKQLQNRILSVKNRTGHLWNFQVVMYSTMYDEKLERKLVGLAGSSSEFLCTMCETTRSEAFTSPLKYTDITRTHEQNMERADGLYTNDSNLSYKALQSEAKGVKTDSFTDITPHIDALHSEINNALWLKKIFVREMAGLTESWSYRDAPSKQKR